MTAREYKKLIRLYKFFFFGAEMLESDDQRKQKAPWKSIGHCAVSFVSAFFTQFALSMVPRFFPTSSLFILLSLSVMVLLAVAGIGRCCKGLLRVRASAPAFVFFNILFIWGFYIAVIREVISPLMDIILNAELAMLVIGLHSILSSDPGFVTYGSSCSENLVNIPLPDVEAHSEELELSTCGMHHEFPAEDRVRYCRHCNACVKGFDHHCPAFGNCIGKKNHALFIILLVGFVTTEASYVACSSQFATKSQIAVKIGWETSLSGNLAISTMLFSLLQVLWQGVFLTWHIYCVCFNIKTDEWINWKRYPEFHLVVQPQPGQTMTEIRFRNPYDKGILCNMKEFLVT